MCALFYSNASWVYVVGWLPDIETYKSFSAKHAFLASPGKAVEKRSYDMHAQDLCSKGKKKKNLHTGKKTEMIGSIENLGRTSEWDMMSGAISWPRFSLSCIGLWVSMPCIPPLMMWVTTERRNSWVWKWGWDGGAWTRLCSQAQATNVHWFLYHTRMWWEARGNQRGPLPEINSVEVNMGNAFMIFVSRSQT